MSTENARVNGTRTSKLWVPIVILIGGIAGVLLYLWSLVDYYSYFGFHREYPFFQGGFPGAFGEFHIILSTVGIALLAALLVVYGRTYRQTKANFVLGLLVVLFALLLQSILTSPIIVGLIEHESVIHGFYSPAADVFTIIAYTVFLYLSLE